MSDEGNEPAYTALNAPGKPGHAAQLTDAIGDAELTRLSEALGHAPHVDLARYRDTTVRRQVVRRMQAVGDADIDSYIERVRSSSEEARRLQESVFVAVTAFFRDPDVFVQLKSWLTEHAATLAPGAALRVWVPGCASGEEAYTFAILLHEALGARIGELDVHVFATDADERATRSARSGLYPREAVQALSDAQIQRYFVPDREQVRVAKHVRDLCVFATHDLLRQPPFRNMDVVSCRNVLIYFQRDFRQEVLNKLHYALKPGGCLVLGQAESVGAVSTLFESIDSQLKLYVRRPGPSPRLLEMMGREPPPRTDKPSTPHREDERPPIDQAVEAALSEAYVPPSVVVNERGDILHLSGDTQRYLRLPRGRGDFAVTSLCAPELRGEIKTLLHLLSTRPESQLAGRPVRLENGVGVRVVGRKLRARDGDQELGLVLSFEERPAADPLSTAGSLQGDELHTELSELRQELGATREHLHSLVEQLESANERMLSANQELQASSEETQSSNEELQASNEELLSLNEELQLKSQDLIRANDTLSSVQNSIQVALVVVDADANVLSFNALAVRIFGLMPRDHGRSITAVPCSLRLPDLPSLVVAVVISGEPTVHRIDDDDRHYLLQVSPYENAHRERTGAVLAFTDVGELRRAEQRSQRMFEHYRATFEQATTGIAHVSLEGRWLRANPSWCQTLGYSEEELLQLTVAQTTHPDDSAFTESQFSTKPLMVHNELEKRYLHKLGHVVWAQVAFTTISATAAEPSYRVCVIQDISQRKLAEQRLRDSANEFRQIAASLPLLPWAARADGWVDFYGEQWSEYLGIEVATLLAEGWDRFMHPDDRRKTRTVWRETVASGEPGYVQMRLRRHDGMYRWFEVRARPVLDESGKLVRWFGANTDIHDAQTMHDKLESTLDALRFALSDTQVATFAADRPRAPGVMPEVSRRENEDMWALLGTPLDNTHPPVERFREVVHPDDLTRVLTDTNSGLVSGEPFEVSYRTHPERGPQRWMLTRARPVKDADGVCRRYHGMLIDITAQKRVEQRHQEILRSLTRANAIAGIGHFRYDITNARVSVDDVVRAQLDLPGLEFATELARERLDPEVAGAVRARFVESVRRGSASHEDVLCFLVRGQRRYLRVQLEVEYDAEGTPSLLIGATHDITAQHEAQLSVQSQRDELERLVEVRTRDLRQKEGQLQAILDGVPCAIGYWDADGRSRFANDAHRDWLATSPADMAGVDIRALWRDSFARDLEVHLTQVLAGHAQDYELEVAAGPEDARRFARVYLLPDGHGDAVAGFLSLIFDVTSLKLAEQQADAARKAKGQFLANMSHEIRTPLTAVLGLAELGKRSAPTRDSHERFENILRAGRHLLNVISDILDFSRIEAGKLEIDVQPCDLGELLAQTSTTLAGAAREKGLELRFVELPDLPRTVRTDGLRLAQVLVNLLSNGVKFTEQGYVETTLGYGFERLTLQVTDSGMGMSEDTRRRLFEPFEQGVPRSGTRQAGTGLGLAICKRIVALMNGTLEIVSSPGAGTTVRVSVPCTVLAPPDFSALRRTAFLDSADVEVEALIHALRTRNVHCEKVAALQAWHGDFSCIIVRSASLPQLHDVQTARWLHAGGRIVVLQDASGEGTPVDAPSWLSSAISWAQLPATPLTLLLALEQAREPVAEPKAPQSALPLTGVRVLAAEDHEINRHLLREMLSAAGASLVCVENGAKVVTQLLADGRDAYDVVLCDIEMPELDGYAATERMRVFAPDLPIIGLTAHAFELARERGRIAGMNDFLTKPYSLRALIDVVARHAAKPPISAIQA